MNLLLLSSSRVGATAYLEHALSWIQSHVPNRHLVFIPFAGVTIQYDDYVSKVAEALAPLDISVESLHRAVDPHSLLRQAPAIAVGGGNTFALLKSLYDQDLVDLLRECILADIPYLAWSAGSNIAAPTICTTNDMPIVQPRQFAALNLVPFQINPHYHDTHPADFHGETRAQRLMEYLMLNPERKVVALREGSALKIQAGQCQLLGPHQALLFQSGQKITLCSSDTLTGLL